MKRGFTLVELSIVLVIIGLLVGGILVAQSMVDTAKITSQVRQLEQFDVASSNFKTKYNSYPGDSATFSATGNGNGILEGDPLVGSFIGWGTSSTPKVTGSIANSFDGEVALFWSQLVTTGLKLESMSSPSTDASGGIVIDSNIPKSSIGNAGVFATTAYGIFGSGSVIWAYVITNNNPPVASATFDSTNGAASLEQTLALDTKIDDGVTYTGDLKSSVVSANGKAFISTYTASSTSATPCAIFVKMWIRGGL